MALKLENEYVRALGAAYSTTPKAIYAALAYSLALRLCEDDHARAVTLLGDEWANLHGGGIVPQAPKGGR
jgi:hypothetical protein